MTWNLLLYTGGAYLIGAIPFGYLISKIFFHIDIREHGSKNPGATNVWRTLGKGPGATTLILDLLKGFIPIYLIFNVLSADLSISILSGVACIAGHVWSVFLLGRGGKGVITSAGVFFALAPKPTAVALVVFLLFLLATKYVSVASIASAIGLIIAGWIFEPAVGLNIVITAASILVILKHHSNIKRLMAGTENKAKF